MRNVILAVMAIALATSACATRGAGTTQDPCGLAEVKASAPAGGNAQAQSQALESGQRASNQPVQTDPAKWSPGTTWGGGAGAVSAQNNWWEDRNLAGAPSSNQALVIHGTQDQEQQAGGSETPQIQSVREQIKNAEGRLMLLLSQGNAEQADKERELLLTLNQQLATAQSSNTKTVNITYDLRDSVPTLGLSSASTAAGEPGKASTSGEGETNATAEELAGRAGAVPPSTFPPAAPEGDSPRSPAPVEPE